MFSNVECDRSAEVYAEIIAGVKFACVESRYCSTRAVSSWSLQQFLACGYCHKHQLMIYIPHKDSVQSRDRPIAIAK